MLSSRPMEALTLAERVVASPDASAEIAEAALLTLDEKEWTHVRQAHQLAEARRTGKVETGTFFDELEAETGGNVTAEALEAFMARIRGGE